MKRILIGLFILIILLALPIVALGQDSPVTAELPSWASGLPATLVQMVSLNLAFTEMFKRWLANPALPYTPSEKTRGLLVIIASFVIGVGSAFMYPESLTYVSTTVHPVLQYLFVGVSVSVLGGFAYELKSRLAPTKPSSLEAKG